MDDEFMVKLRSWVKVGDIISGVKIHPFMIFSEPVRARKIDADLYDIHGFYYPGPALEVLENADNRNP